MNTDLAARMNLFALGFRPFFLCAGFAGLAYLAFWERMYARGVIVGNYHGYVAWHAHEMIFGYTAAVIAGFLLTAVRNWTNVETAKGSRLLALTLVWLYGRIAPFYAEVLPGWLIAAVDLAFIPWLAMEITGPLVRGKHFKNLGLVGVLLAMAFANLLHHLDVLGVVEGGVELGTKLSVAMVVLLILIIGGRVLPFFTERGIPGSAPRRRTGWDMATIVVSVLVFGVDAFDGAPAIDFALAVAAAGLNGYRLAGWYDRGVWREPLLWVLYLGYGWLIVGFAMMALAAYGIVSPNLSVHALTVGGIGVLTLGMMARVSLGHTGRPLRCHSTMVAAFVLINLAAFARVVVPALAPAAYAAGVSVSAWLWLGAFALFVVVYAPILVAPRADGWPG